MNHLFLVLAICRSEAPLPKVEVPRKDISRAVECVCADLRSLESPAPIVSEALTLKSGNADILVTNAAAELSKPLEATNADNLTNIYGINVGSPSILTQALLPYL